jgi:hypothetical protein
MYVINSQNYRRKIFIKYLLFGVLFLALIGLVVWFLFYKNNDSSASFTTPGTNVANVKVATRDFENEYFKITLPTTWVDLGRQNPFSYEVYYEFQNTLKDFDNRWVRVYVDVVPNTQAVTRLLPVTVVDNHLVPGELSDTCWSFSGAPAEGSSQSAAQFWIANWQGIEFNCNMNVGENFMGTASSNEGYGVTLINQDGTSHKYFIAYIDHNIHPDNNFIIDVVNSFETR